MNVISWRHCPLMLDLLVRLLLCSSHLLVQPLPSNPCSLQHRTSWSLSLGTCLALPSAHTGKLGLTPRPHTTQRRSVGSFGLPLGGWHHPSMSQWPEQHSTEAEQSPPSSIHVQIRSPSCQHPVPIVQEASTSSFVQSRPPAFLHSW